ncbi:PREDICTED: serine/arginine-rich splicing factor SR30-like isoform X4 [Nicotiana attenuata]|uniref:serine/arginine-rich splicing factor SR30-like isoform X4 n=2 Tax=Nicotiana attenuata TaxID=49451 RepID=UPI000905972B|nr:PREDICTED: serine/arginine-rich splicing factor SR30-like isoform X4 [Nicotiana attenuata]
MHLCSERVHDVFHKIRKLDESLFHNQFSQAYIRVYSLSVVEEYDKRRSKSYSGSRSPRRSYSSQSRRGKYSHRSASLSHSRFFSHARSVSR